MTETESIEKEVGKIKWYHTIDLGNGIITPGSDATVSRLKLLKFPENFEGKTVLDIGAWDGFFSFEAERRGAKKVLATDSYVWQKKSWGSKDGFDLARKVLASHVVDKEIDVYGLSKNSVGTFDIVLFLGVLYHLRHPLLALERVAEVTGEHLILETHADLLGYRYPMMRLYPGNELDSDSSNWWGPNPEAIEEMLRIVGFKKVELIYPRYPKLTHSIPYRLARSIKHLLFSRRHFFNTFTQGRVVFHAWK